MSLRNFGDLAIETIGKQWPYPDFHITTGERDGNRVPVNLHYARNVSKLLYIDFDDVLCETALAFTRILLELFGRRVAFDDIREFDLEVSFSLTPQQHEHLMHVGHEPEFLGSVVPVPGAVDGMRQLKDIGFEIAIVTGRPPHCGEISAEWLTRHGIPFDRVLHVNKYGRLTGSQIKQAITLEKLKEIEFCAAVEDAPGMAAFLVNAMTMPVLVFKRPWNIDAVIGADGNADRLLRCHDWNHILETLVLM